MNRYFYTCALLMGFLSGSTFVSAQGGYGISGTVVDQQGPVVGATVMEQGTSNATLSGPDGDYSLMVSSPDALVEIYPVVPETSCAVRWWVMNRTHIMLISRNMTSPADLFRMSL